MQQPLGPKLKAFEKRIAEYAGVNYAVATNSGTSALHLIIRALGIGEVGKVITASFCCLFLSCVL
ncbi:DegT/DnrJ/EryC1/StrS family aminotransferase [Candidatus Bipolaricaulota bacterium]|nr:DegT/DnrJ/EryC1/StrS family aminotransferase [Candidatus Bipolaricaulota bacterium]